jgi:hypothetical protein
VRVTISRGVSFSDFRKIPVIVDAGAAVDAVEALIRNSWTASDIFLIEEAHEDFGELNSFRPFASSAGVLGNLKIT